MRQPGKTTFLREQLAKRLAGGRSRDSLLLISLEDDRLGGIEVSDLDWILEEIFR